MPECVRPVTFPQSAPDECTRIGATSEYDLRATASPEVDRKRNGSSNSAPAKKWYQWIPLLHCRERFARCVHPVRVRTAPRNRGGASQQGNTVRIIEAELRRGWTDRDDGLMAIQVKCRFWISRLLLRRARAAAEMWL